MQQLMDVRLLLCLGGMLLLNTLSSSAGERQITNDANYNHELDNNDNFSPDDRFLAFDTRPGSDLSQARVIAKVEIATGKITTLYKANDPNEFGPGVLAASFSHVRDEVIFIHGPLNPTGADDQYEKHRRIGAIVSGDGSGNLKFADARNTKPPFVPGALRGGTHRHEWSGDGRWVGFTYNDAVVRAHGLKIGKELDLRTIGVTKLGSPVTVPKPPQFRERGEGFSVLVVAVTPDPEPGSDEISYAAGDSWVGRNGYPLSNGKRQLARAFIGTARDDDGKPIDDLFIVDIPEDISKPGPLGPLEGTATRFPAPPAGTVQRRLTRTANKKYPGCEGIARSSHEGTQIAFRMRDENGDWQIFLISPLGGPPRQATKIEGGVDTDARWHPSGDFIACVAGNKILVTDVRSGDSRVLIDRAPAPFALVWSHDGRTIAYNRKVQTAGKDITQIFVSDFETPAQ